MKDRSDDPSHHERTLLPRSYISVPCHHDYCQTLKFYISRSSQSSTGTGIGVITPNKIPLTTIVTYLQKRYRSRISNHWATIPACSVVPPIYKQSKKTYCHIYHFSDLQWQPSDSHKMSVAIFTPTPDIKKCQMSRCNNSSDNKSYRIHKVYVKVSAQVTTVTYMHQSQPSSHSLRINLTVHLEL